jgi:hypothetical protein
VDPERPGGKDQDKRRRRVRGNVRPNSTLEEFEVKAPAGEDGKTGQQDEQAASSAEGRE